MKKKKKKDDEVVEFYGILLPGFMILPATVNLNRSCQVIVRVL